MDNGTAVEVRLALCVERIEALQKTLEIHITDQEAIMRNVRKDIGEINRALTRYKGTLGGVILTLSGVGTIVAIFWTWLIGEHGG